MSLAESLSAGAGEVMFCMAFEYSDGAVSILVTDNYWDAMRNLTDAIEFDPRVTITYLESVAA